MDEAFVAEPAFALEQGNLAGLQLAKIRFIAGRALALLLADPVTWKLAPVACSDSSGYSAQECIPRKGLKPRCRN